MKKFFKQLAFASAFAMVATSVAPAAPALAAKAPALNATSKTLLLGNEDRNAFDFNLNNKVAGSKYTWTTSNAKVATVKSNGYVTAKGNGKAVISLKITLPTGKTSTLKAAVTVKTNANSVEVTNVPEKAIKVGETVNLNRSYTTLAGASKTTDITRFVITSDNADKATINAASGHFTATVPGVYTVKAIMAQSASKFEAGVYTAESKEVKVNVAGLVSAKEIKSTQVEATFGAPVEASDVSVYQVVSGNKVNQLVKKVTLSEDKKTATIDLYLPLTAEKTYGVALKDNNSLEFVAATQKLEDVASYEIVTSDATVEVAKKIEVKLYNANGVDITNDSLLKNVTISSDSLTSYFNTTTNEITFYTVDDKATITAQFHTYKYDNNTGKELTLAPVTKVIVSKSAAATVTGTIEKSTVLLNGEALNNFATNNHQIPHKDASRLVVQLTETTGTNKVSYNSIDTSYFTFESTDDTTVIANPDGTLFTVKEGSAVILVKYGKDASKEKAVIGAITVTVVAERKAVDLKFDKTAVRLSNSTNYADTQAITVQLVDRYGKGIGTQANTKVELLGNYTDAEKLALATLVQSTTVNAKNETVITFAGVGIAKGSYQYKVSNGTFYKVVNVVVDQPTGTAESDIKTFKLVTSSNAVDLKLDANNTTKTVSVDLVGLASNGVVVQEVTAASGYLVKVIKPGTSTEVAVTGSIDFLAGGEKAKVGTYVLRAYKPVTGGQILVAQDTIVVTDTQEKAKLAEVKELTFKKADYANSTTLLDLAAAAFVVKVDNTVQTVSKVNFTGSVEAGSVWIESVEVSRTIGTTTFKDVVDVKLVARFN